MLIVRARRSDQTFAFDLSLEAGLALLADPLALVWFDIDEESIEEIDSVAAALGLGCWATAAIRIPASCWKSASAK